MNDLSSNNQKKTAIIISLNFRVAHTSHLVASYNQMQELGYRSILFISKDLIPYLPPNIDFVTSLNEIDRANVAIFWFPAFGNFNIMRKLKSKFNSRIIYVLHEPLEQCKVYRDAGLSATDIIKVYLQYTFNLVLVKKSDVIILPSKKAIDLYQSSICRKVNKNFIYLPLIFDDESSSLIPQQREYVSYIGTISEDHAFNEFIDFIITATSDKTFPQVIKFLIATRNSVDRSNELLRLENEGRLKIIDGHPLSDTQINEAYAQSYIVWNAYHRTTQSGVLAKASMFGTPAIILRRNTSEFTKIGENVLAIDDNKNYSQIKDRILKVYYNFEIFSKSSRQIFKDNFYYRNHNDIIASIL